MRSFHKHPNQKYMEFHYRVFQELCETNYENLELEAPNNVHILQHRRI